MHNYTTLQSLHERGVHLVLCDGKVAVTKNWQKNAPSLQHVLEHKQSGGALGFIPGVSGLWVLDVDNSQDVTAIKARLGERGAQALAMVETKRGCHVYFKKNGSMVSNRQWAYAGLQGDVRGDRGYCIAWEPEALQDALDALEQAIPTDDKLFPKPDKAAGPQLVEGGRNNALNTLIYGKAQAGQTDFHLERDDAIASGLNPSEVDATIKSATVAATSHTFPRKDATALESVFEQMGWKARYNQRSMRCDWSLDAGATWGSTNDRLEKKRRRTIAETFTYRSVKEGKKVIRPLVYGRDAWEEHLGAILADHEVDPFRLWLESLPQWDGKKRLHRLLADTFKADDNPLTQWAATALLLGPVQRCFEPGCKLDEVVVLIGAQGIGKSSLLSNLLPPTEPDWFSDSLSMTDNLQKRVESLQGRVLVELSDLQGFTKADMQSMKAFITRRDDGSVRLSFRRNPETMLRRCVLVGSSDRLECLPNDSAGNRRFVPVECKEGSHVERFMTANREQLWAEAVVIYRGGEVRANLPRNLMLMQSDRAESHRRKDQVIEDAVAGIVGVGPFTIGELFRMACPSSSASDRRAVNRLADALRIAGWSKKRERTEHGGLAYLWRRGD